MDPSRWRNHADQAAVARAPLIDWLCEMCTVHRDAPTVAVVDASLQAHRLELLRQDLPGRFLPPATIQGDGPVAATLGEFPNEYPWVDARPLE
jgi:hypothetical protein